MESLWDKILNLISRGEVKISAHGYDELAADGLSVREIMLGVGEGIVIEYYPQYKKGPCVLVFQKDRGKGPVHVVWGIPKEKSGPAVLVTAYRPDPGRWRSGFKRRKKWNERKERN
jgi:hypothetical protein